MSMRKLGYILALFFANIGFSQVYEAGVSYNMGGVLGDIRTEVVLVPSIRNWGVSLKKNMNPRIACRWGLNYIKSDLAEIVELAGGIEYNFTSYNLIRTGSKKKQSPYIIFEFAALAYYNGNNIGYTFGVPMGAGYKIALSKRIVGAVEAKYRTVLTDKLDYIKINKSTLDAYYYIGASIYYTFGWPKGSKNQIRF